MEIGKERKAIECTTNVLESVNKRMRWKCKRKLCNQKPAKAKRTASIVVAEAEMVGVNVQMSRDWKEASR
jgi:transposase-like protein